MGRVCCRGVAAKLSTLPQSGRWHRSFELPTKDRSFGLSVERAVFVATLHRLIISGSGDRSVWRQDYDTGIGDDFEPHHLCGASLFSVLSC
jgi:hypothetical protein